MERSAQSFRHLRWYGAEQVRQDAMGCLRLTEFMQIGQSMLFVLSWTVSRSR